MCRWYGERTTRSQDKSPSIKLVSWLVPLERPSVIPLVTLLNKKRGENAASGSCDVAHIARIRAGQ